MELSLTKKDDENHPVSVVVPSRSRKKKNKRKRSRGSPSSLILNGKVLAISICDHDTNVEEESQAHSYKDVYQLCLDLGATVSPQVHKRVFAVVCTPEAVSHCSQRVRKVLKKQKSTVGLIHVQWLYDCQKEDKCIDWVPYSLNEMGRESLVQFEARVSGAATQEQSLQSPNKKQKRQDDSVSSKISHLTEEVSIALDCCCVCHDTDRDDCKWCVDCNVTKNRKGATGKLVI